jgi:caffeoyl-CoA O-methyltransferase
MLNSTDKDQNVSLLKSWVNEKEINAMMDEINNYLLNILPPRDELLQKMERYGEDHRFPFIGPLVGEFLSILTKSIGAKTVFEMGSGYGFSAVHFARALPPDGKVICTDGDKNNAKIANEFFLEAGLANKIEFYVGDAITILNEYQGPFDIILMDIDKEGYPQGFQAAWKKLSVGGLLITDNVLWSGRVMTDDQSPATNGIREFTQMIYSTPHAQTSILPLRDGLSVTLKTK